ncbi:MAG TPA: CRISPR-associated helicase Cas3' [Bacillales bacterium]|nr:CRISPR-associated helicase Cas3' [Bacillales bacterium]
MNRYWAHSEREGTSEKQELGEHLENTARIAESFAKSFDPERLSFYAGLWHDLGKYYHEFQDYLDNPTLKRDHRDHSTAGGIYAYESLDWSQAFIVMNLIFGHHSGLVPAGDLMNRLDKNKNEHFIRESIEKGASFLKNYTSLISNSKSAYWNFESGMPDMVSLEMRIRMLFSALVDADFLDTEHHFYPKKTHLRTTSDTPAELYQLLTTHYQTLEQSEKAKESINRARSAIYHQCIDKADNHSIFYLLSVPTGLGKTLSSMGFALRHAMETGKKRVIVALPFTSIIDQNAAEYKKIFGDEFVLEHHSRAAWGEGKLKDDEKMKLAAENWDIPIIITSTVQLFESLFANKTSATRKLHNIADSVIILDEFQMLPINLLEPIFATMEELMRTYNVTIVASSATPLSFEWKDFFQRVGQPVPLIDNSESLFEKHLRVEFHYNPEPITWDDLSQQILEHKQALAIVNTKKDALELYNKIKQQVDHEDVFHLSTLMCSRHRQDILDQVKEKLENNKPVYLISTQLIEAGVDIDFPAVFRAIASLDRIIQAAGRCNREGELSEKGQVVIFDPIEGGMPPGMYKTAAEQTKITLKDQWQELHLPDTYVNFFKKLYSLNNKMLDKTGVQRKRTDPNKGLDFPQIAKDFKMIDEDTVSVMCPYDEEGEMLKQELKHRIPDRLWYRRAQPYVVNLQRNDPVFKEQPQSFREITDDWFVLETHIYDSSIGLNRSMEYSSDQLNF